MRDGAQRLKPLLDFSLQAIRSVNLCYNFFRHGNFTDEDFMGDFILKQVRSEDSTHRQHVVLARDFPHESALGRSYLVGT